MRSETGPGPGGVWRSAFEGKFGNLEGFIGYLEDQGAVAAHILQIRSTHQYYRTAKYGLMVMEITENLFSGQSNILPD